MLLEFSCANHKSIKGKITFSTIAGSDGTFDNMLKEFNNLKILRSAAIYGANGSGKSNVLNALVFMKNLVINSINHQPGQEILQAPHKLSSSDVPSEYNIQFVKNDVRYAYGFSIVKNIVKDEYLYYFPKGRPVKIFERDGEQIKPGDKYKKSFELSFGVLKENRLFLSCIANYTNLKEVEAAFIFFRTDVVVYNPVINNWIEYSMELLQNDSKIKDRFIDILKALDTDIQDIHVKLKKEKLNIIELPQELLSEKFKTIMSEQYINKIEAKVIYKDFETDLMLEESDGIKKLFEIVCPIIDIINKGKVLICDEIEKGLHESVVHEIVRLFQNARKDVFAQLIFTTHDTSLLDSNLFRRDQIWFTQQNDERATDLYSLVQIKNVRKTENLERGYVSGKYGGIPMLNKSFFNAFEEKID